MHIQARLKQPTHMFSTRTCHKSSEGIDKLAFIDSSYFHTYERVHPYHASIKPLFFIAFNHSATLAIIYGSSLRVLLSPYDERSFLNIFAFTSRVFNPLYRHICTYVSWCSKYMTFKWQHYKFGLIEKCLPHPPTINDTSNTQRRFQWRDWVDFFKRAYSWTSF